MRKIISIVADTDQWFFEKKVLYYSIFFHLLAVFFSDGFHRPDEHLGMLRMMAYKLNWLTLDETSWEIPAQIRSYTQPFIYYVVTKIYTFFLESNPFSLATIYRFITSSFAMIGFYFFSRSLPYYLKTTWQLNIGRLFLYGSWFLPFIHARTTTENFSTTLICFIFYFVTINGTLPLEEKKKSFRNIFIISMLIIFAMFARVQSLSITGPLVLFLIYQSKNKLGILLLGLLTGCIAGLVINLGIDYWGYSSLTFTPWNNLYLNLFKGVASSFGTDPWYRYVEKIISRGIPPYSLLVLISFILFWIKNPLSIITLMTLPFFISHSVVAHKELRFMYLATPFCALVVPWFLNYLKDRNLFRWKPLLWVSLGWIIIVQTLILTAYSSLRPAYSTLGIYKYLYDKTDRPKTIYTLNYVTDVLKFYLKEPLNFHYVKSEKIEDAFSESQHTDDLYILTDKYEHHLQFANMKGCNQEYLSSSLFFNKYFPKLAMKSKIWGVYKCSQTKE